jgi:hypothetical protein
VCVCEGVSVCVCVSMYVYGIFYTDRSVYL